MRCSQAIANRQLIIQSAAIRPGALQLEAVGETNVILTALAITEPGTAEELTYLLQMAAARKRRICVFGNNSKRLAAGPVTECDIALSTARLRRVLEYERNDLTIRVEPGLPFHEVQSILKRNGQMIALDPPFSETASVGGVVAADSSGPLRRAFGTARDLVIGMEFATIEGKLVRTGGMVVKNVAGLDMGKVLIGSFGTLAVISSINFRVHSLPPRMRTFLFSFVDLDSALQKRDALRKSQLQPLAVDLLNPPASARIGLRGYALAVRAGGTSRVLRRYADELSPSDDLTEAAELSVWRQIREFTPDFLRRESNGVVFRVSTTLSDVGHLIRFCSDPVVCRAASGVTYIYVNNERNISALTRECSRKGWTVVVEYASDEFRASRELWLEPISETRVNAFRRMQNMKQMFDPDLLLNRGRLYGRI